MCDENGFRVWCRAFHSNKQIPCFIAENEHRIQFCKNFGKFAYPNICGTILAIREQEPVTKTIYLEVNYDNRRRT